MNELTDKDLNLIGAKWYINMFDDVDKAEIFAFTRAAIDADRAQRQAGQEPKFWYKPNPSSVRDLSFYRTQTYTEPLYAAPQPAQADKDAEIAKHKLHIAVLEQMLGHALDADKEAEIVALKAGRDALLGALKDLTEAGEEAWGSERPCVRIAIEALQAQAVQHG